MSIVEKFKKFRSKSSSNGKKEGDEKNAKPEAEMSFLEHLEELRWHLMRSFAAIVVIAITISFNINWLLDDIVLAPFSKNFPTNELLCYWDADLCFEKIDVVLIAIEPYEQFLKFISLSLITGFILAFPYFIWEIWRFVKPGLHEREQNGLRGNVLIMSILFFMGVSFAYYVVLPFSVMFLSTFTLSDDIANQWKIGKVISMVTQIVLAGGILFEMPIIVYYLSKIGLVTPEFMRAYRRHAIVVLLILSAVITPPDWITQILIFLPLVILYEISIVISKVVTRNREKELAA